MNGVMIPEVSAGSNQVGASEMWTAQVICPSGAASARLLPSALSEARRNTRSPSNRVTRLMDVLRRRSGSFAGRRAKVNDRRVRDPYMLTSRGGEVGSDAGSVRARERAVKTRSGRLDCSSAERDLSERREILPMTPGDRQCRG